MPVRDLPHPRGQALVETALLMPILLLLMALSLDVGRAFLGSIGVQNLSRIGANYAAGHAESTDWGPTSRYWQLMARDAQAIGCDDTVVITPPTFTPSPPAFGGDVTVSVSCQFGLVTPIASNLLGNFIDVEASSTFPVWGMCPDCGPPPPIDPPPPTPETPCNQAPELTGLSVGGARLAWELAGFTGAFTPPPDADDGRTVNGRTLSEVPDEDGCLPHNTTAIVTYQAVDPATCTDGSFLPNLKGMSVAAARDVWDGAGFDPDNMLPSTAPNDSLVDVQIWDPSTLVPDACVATDDIATTTVTVTTTPAPAAAPQYCEIPDFHSTSSETAGATWTAAGFTSSVAFLGSRPYDIEYQSLVAQAFELCSAPITVGPNPVEGS